MEMPRGVVMTERRDNQTLPFPCLPLPLPLPPDRVQPS